MATKAQIAANRLNSQKSSGPRTDKGRLISCQNAVRHGLCSGVPLMTDETNEEVQALLSGFRLEYQPVGPTEEVIVYKMTEHCYFAKRASYLMTEQADWADQGGENAPKLFSLYLRYYTAADRGFFRALKELRNT